MDTFIPLQDAVAEIGHEALEKLIASGKIKPAMLATTGILLVKRSELPVRREDSPEWAEVAHLRGIGIGVRQAAEKYGLVHTTITRWIDRGLVRRISGETIRGQKVLIDEGDVAYCAMVYRKNPGQGKRTLEK